MVDQAHEEVPQNEPVSDPEPKVPKILGSRDEILYNAKKQILKSWKTKMLPYEDPRLKDQVEKVVNYANTKAQNEEQLTEVVQKIIRYIKLVKGTFNCRDIEQVVCRYFML